MSTKKRAQTEWYNHVAQWRKSGLTRTAYCEQHDLKLHALMYWIKRCDAKSEANGALTLVPARMTSALSQSELALILECPNGSKLHLPISTSAIWLGALLGQLS